MVLFAILLSVFAAFLWAITNHIDKFLISKLVRNSNYRGLIIFSSLVSGLILVPLYAIITKLEVGLPILAIFTIWVAMTALLVSILFYYKALARQDASTIAIMMQLTPVFVYILGIFFLGERLTDQQVIGGIIIVVASILITYEVGRRRFGKKKLRSLVLMLLSTLFLAVYHVLFRTVTRDYDFNVAIFWSNVLTVANGAILLVAFRSYRRAFSDLVRKNGIKAFALNVINEIAYSGGNIVVSYAALFVPLVITNLVSNIFQPIFVFAIGLILSIFLSKNKPESLKKTVIFQKIFCIILSVVGLVLLLT